MTRRSLRPQLNQIRAWVRQGRTDAWIAHQLEVTVQQIKAFKKQHKLTADGEEVDSVEEVDLRAEDDAAIAEELEVAEREEKKRRAEEEKKRAEEELTRAEEKRLAAEKRAAEGGDEGEEDEDDKKPRRRRTTRSRRRGGVPKSFEGTFDHGDEGYGLWLDPSVQDSPIYAEHWAGHRPVEVTIEEEQIIIRRAGASADDS